MKKSVRLFSILVVFAMLLAPTSAFAQKPDPARKLVELQLLAFNDYHGFLETSSVPGPGNVGADPAGGGEYLSAKLSQLRQGKQYSITVAAGDLIGGSPFLS